MIKKLFTAVVGVLAINFLFVAGGVGYLVATKKIDREKVLEIRSIVLGPATAPSTRPATQPTTQDATPDTPMLRIDALLAKVRDQPAPVRIDFVRGQLDAQAATIERRDREVADQRAQLDTAIEELKKQRETLVTERQAFDNRKAEQAKLDADTGFQKSLELYGTLPPKQVKAIFATLDDDTVVRYLQSMDAKQAGNVLKEFKTPAEVNRAQAYLERIRRAQAKAD